VLSNKITPNKVTGAVVLPKHIGNITCREGFKTLLYTLYQATLAYQTYGRAVVRPYKPLNNNSMSAPAISKYNRIATHLLGSQITD